MLTHEQIVQAVDKVTTKFPLKSVSYFGSYADGSATEESDLDLLVEFANDEEISLLDVVRLQHNLEDELSIKVDVVEVPLTEKTRIKIGVVVPVYGQIPAVIAMASVGRQIGQHERDENLLLYIKDKAEYLLEVTERYDVQMFLGDECANRGVSFCLMKIGQFVKSVSEELKQENKDIEWTLFSVLPDMIISEHQDLAMSQIWKNATVDVPILLKQVNGILLAEGVEK
jgi:predicted nucleotidyltransferase/uncharacterized protein with HEPN domain